MNIVWFKRDLRIDDNAALNMALQAGNIMPLYIFEPQLWQQPDMSYRQYSFLLECLADLNTEIKKLGTSLIIKVGDAVGILNKLNNTHKITGLYSHQETWNMWTYNRDKQVKKWTKDNNITWHEPTQSGVIRVLQNRDGWAAKWYKQMQQPIIAAPKKLNSVDIRSECIPSANELGINNDGILTPQKGGRDEALKLLHSFLHDRGERYTKEMSSPVTAYDSCSRLSAHIAFGCVSIREVFQTTEKRIKQIKDMTYGTKGKWPSAMRSFSGRLRWHCHFIQKLEDTPEFEIKNMHTAYNGLRENDFNEQYFNAWQQGKTGYPMIDACMRSLIATGWLNFRMRAMLMSFASYHLWLDWRKTAPYLAGLFTDYEPGIHYSQVQMQSGTTGINSIRIYNPIKQGVDHDPTGVFIRQWIPELKYMPDEHIHTPWKSPNRMGSYPMPIVDEKLARKQAADKLYAVRKKTNYKQQAANIVHKHGSRKSGLPRTIGKKRVSKNPKQTELDL